MYESGTPRVLPFSTHPAPQKDSSKAESHKLLCEGHAKLVYEHLTFPFAMSSPRKEDKEGRREGRLLGAEPDLKVKLNNSGSFTWTIEQIRQEQGGSDFVLILLSSQPV